MVTLTVNLPKKEIFKIKEICRNYFFSECEFIRFSIIIQLQKILDEKDKESIEINELEEIDETPTELKDNQILMGGRVYNVKSTKHRLPI